MRMFMRGVLAVLFLLGVAICGLCLWPATLAVWQGKILLDAAGVAALSTVMPVFLAGVATCAGTAVAIAQLDRAASLAGDSALATTLPAVSPRPTPAIASAATSATATTPASVTAGQAGAPSTARRATPNPLK